jgi:mono/diheme cytochrome c family protein
MAEVVLGSTQHLDDADLRAMAIFLRALPQRPSAPAAVPQPVASERLERGARLYARHCADCHGERGEGGGIEGQRLVPPLAGRRIVTMEPPVNLLRVILGGGFAPATSRQPQPFGMPPFVQLLSDEEVADLASYLRRSWGHQASTVGALQVNQLRAGIGND